MNELTYSNSERANLLPLYIFRTGVKDPQYPIIRKQGYPAWQLSVCFKGSGKFICNNKEYTINVGDVFLFGPKIPHEYFSNGSDWGIYFFAFSGDAMDQICEYMGINNGYSVVSSNDDDSFLEKSKKLHTVFNEDVTNEMEASTLLYSMLSDLCSSIKQNKENSGSEQNETFSYTVPAIEFMRKNFKKQLSLDDISDVINVSKSYICRMFKKAYGQTPIQILTDIRIQHAKKLLSSTDIKIKLLAEECGFLDSSYFCLVFRQSVGMTPEEYRKLQTE